MPPTLTAARQTSPDLVLAYLVLTGLAMFKNVGVLYFYSQDGGATGYQGLVLALGVADLLAVQPYAFYNAYFLYQSMRAELSYDEMVY